MSGHTSFRTCRSFLYYFIQILTFYVLISRTFHLNIITYVHKMLPIHVQCVHNIIDYKK